MKIVTKEDYSAMLSMLHELSAGSEFVKFSKKIIKTQKEIIGVRTNEIRKLAKQISKCEHVGLFAFGENVTYEEVLIKGMVLACEKDFAQVRPELDKLICLFDSWAEVDMICSSLAFVKGHESDVFEYFSQLTKSQKQFVCRFGIIGLMKYFLVEESIDRVLFLLDDVPCHDYYVEMAIAWLFSEILIKYPQRSIENMKKIKRDYHFSKFVINKSIQKAIESYRIDKILKSELRALKQK